MTMSSGPSAAPRVLVADAADPGRCLGLDLRGSGQRRHGPDHPHHGWAPLPGRPLRRWPDGAGVWVCPVIALDSHEDTVPVGWPQPQWAAGGVGLRPDPNIARVGARDYGLRRGFFRLAGGLKALGLPYALAIDVLSAETRPDLVRACRDGEWGDLEWVAHGLSWNRPLHAGMDEAAELAYLAETRERLAACGIVTNVWHGIEYGQSPRTPALLPRAGYRVCLDWCNDEQPYAFDGAPATGGSAHTAPPVLWSLPQMADLDDGFALCSPRAAGARSYARRIVDAARGLALDGRDRARVMVFTLRPFLSGQPFRIDALLDSFGELSRLPGVRFAHPSAIVAAWQQVAQDPATP
jgi:hypothetical protein